MSNTTQWEDPDTTQANVGCKHVGAVYLIDPTTQKAISPSTGTGNQDSITLLASGAVTTNGNSSDQINANGRGLKLFLTTGAFGSGATAITVTLQGKDPVSTKTYTILTSVSLSASSFVVLSVYPGLTAAANVTANDVLPHTWNVTWQASAWGTGGSVLGISAAIIV